MQRKKPLKRKNSGQAKMFKEIWDSLPHEGRRCFISGDNLNRYLGTRKWFSIFAHVLNKGYYTKWKLNKENIVLLRPDIHALIDQGTVEQRREFSKMTGHSFEGWYSLKEKLRQQYEEDNKIFRKR